MAIASQPSSLKMVVIVGWLALVLMRAKMIWVQEIVAMHLIVSKHKVCWLILREISRR
jgi:hypothetical protein